VSTTIVSNQWCVSTKTEMQQSSDRAAYQVGWWERREPLGPMFEFPALRFESEAVADAAHARLVEILSTGAAHPFDSGRILALMQSE
jgi:hypothetical protein